MHLGATYIKTKGLVQNAGRENEFRQLVKDHELLIYKICAMYMPNEADRKDLFQDIILQLWTSFATFRGESKLSTWIYRVGINTAIRGKRKSKPLQQLQDSFAESIAAEHVADKQVLEEQSKELHIAIQKLNEIEKAIVIFYLEDKSYEEMSEVLGITEGSLRVKMNRIKDKLRQLTKSN